MSKKNPFLGIDLEVPLKLVPLAGMQEAGHRWQTEHIHALVGAYATGRPLLLRGEAGSGKSQLARAAAAVLSGAFFKEVIHARYEARDLMFRLDTLQRLADAQIGTQALQAQVSDLKNYVRKGPLWRALEACEKGAPRAVLLIDEIDKADPDIPNALLDVLANGSFTPEGHDQPVESPSGDMPMVVITTNEERELPHAFVRRCLVLNLNPPKDEEAFKVWLKDRAKSHEALRKVAETVLDEAADQVWRDRKAARDIGQQTVGLAEYIDLLHALVDLSQSSRSESAREKLQHQWLQKLRPYFLVKGADLEQARVKAGRAQAAHG